MDDISISVKPGVNPLMITWLILSFGLSIYTIYRGDAYVIAGYIFLGFAFICFIGFILSATVKSKVGPFIFIIGSIIFVPIGLIGAFGARKALEEYNRLKTLDAAGPDEPKGKDWDKLA